MKSIQDITHFNFFKALCVLPFIEEIWLFGSRARSDHRDRSDIDLLIVAQRVTMRDKVQVSDIIEAADTLLKIDLTWSSELNNVELKNQIAKDHIVLYKRK